MGFMDNLQRALNAMSCNVPNELEVTTVSTLAEDMGIGMKFADSRVIYEVTDRKVKKGIICLYCKTESNSPDGWFTRESYDVVKK